MGTHFFSPANVMKLLENVRGARTSDVTIATITAWGRRIGGGRRAIAVGLYVIHCWLQTVGL